MNSKENNLISSTLVFILLMPIFFYQIKIGSHEIVLNTYAITIFLSIILALKLSKININILIFGLLFSCISMIAVILNENALQTLKYIVLLSPAIFVPLMINQQNYTLAIIKLSYVSLIFALFFYFLNIGVDNSYGTSTRMQGFMSEPSALALPISIIIIFGIYTKNYKYLFIGFMSLIATLSPTVLLVTFISFIVVFFIDSRHKMFIFIMSSLGIYFSLDLIQVVSNYFFEWHVFNRLNDGIINILSFGEFGYNPRAEVAFSFLDDYVSFFGYGLNTYPSARVWNIHLEIIYAFGLVGWFLFILALLYTMKTINNKISLIVFVVSIIYSTFNTAQGIVIYIIVFTYIIYMIASLKRRIY